MHVIKFTIIIADILSYKQSWQLRKLFDMLKVDRKVMQIWKNAETFVYCKYMDSD